MHSLSRPAVRWMFVVAAALFGLKALFILGTPMRALVLSPWLIDDSFIVARVARNIALGHGFSFDGMHPTTGVSMLWTYLTSLNHLVFAKDLAMKVTLLESTAFGSLCTIIMFFLGMRLTGKRSIAWLAFIVTSLLPVLFFNAMNGMETAMFSAFVLLALAGASGSFRYASSAFAHGLITGLWCGLALLTRADAIFVIAAIVILEAWNWARTPAQRTTIVKMMFGMALAIAACFALFSVWQLIQTGTLFPDNQIGRRAIALAKHHFSYAAFSLPAYARIVTWNGFELEALYNLGIGSSLLALVAMLWSTKIEHMRPLLRLSAIYALLFSAALIAYQWYFPDFHGLRYLNPLLHILTLCVVILIVELPLTVWKRTAMTLCVLSLTILTWYRYYDFARRPEWAQNMGLFGQSSTEKQDQFWATIDYINMHTPVDAVIGVRDHGRIATFTDRPIQDLAGILDPGILLAYEQGTLTAYLKEKNVSYIYLPDVVEGRNSIYDALHKSLSLMKLVDAPVEGKAGFTLYKIQ